MYVLSAGEAGRYQAKTVVRCWLVFSADSTMLAGLLIVQLGSIVASLFSITKPRPTNHTSQRPTAILGQMFMDMVSTC